MYDACIVVGDMNYRINGTKKGICEAMSQNFFDVLHFNDQLFFEMKIGTVMKGFHEGKINIAPTYNRNFKDNTGYKLKRNPSWTDRILYKYNDKACQLR